MYEFKKTEDQELLLESLKEVYERNDLDAYFKECDEKHEFPQKAIDVMVDAGFATLGIPEQYGGTEVDADIHQRNDKHTQGGNAFR